MTKEAPRTMAPNHYYGNWPRPVSDRSEKSHRRMTLSSLINKALGAAYRFCLRRSEPKRLGEDQLRRRLLNIEFQQRVVRNLIEVARKQKKERRSLYAEMEALTTEALRLEGQMAAMGPNSVYMQGN